MDIVERLRGKAFMDIHMEAADEIERLRGCADKALEYADRIVELQEQLAAVKQECDALRKIAESKMDEVAELRNRVWQLEQQLLEK